MALAPLERDEFLLYYQPKFKSRTGSLCGAEALIRWHDRAEGLVPPGFFIPMLEESVACGHAQDRNRSFVSDMTATQAGLTLVSTIITLAHSLKLKVVAEGVETEEQARLLRLLDCDEMQGFLFAEPLPCALFEERYLGAGRVGVDVAGG